LEPRLQYIKQLMYERKWNGSELSRHMSVSRSEAHRFLNGKRKGGKKLIQGLLEAFPDEKIESLFILPNVYPNVNTKSKSISIKKHNSSSKAIKHPYSHHIACKIDEITGEIEIVDGKNITTLFVPKGHIEVQHSTKPP